jgi:hypothetical protein
MFLVYDNATHNVLGEYESFTAAEQRRIQLVGANPVLARNVEVVDFDAALDADEHAAAEHAHHAQPA